MQYPNLCKCYLEFEVLSHLLDDDDGGDDDCSKEHRVWDLGSWRKREMAVMDFTFATSPLVELLQGYDVNHHLLSVKL